MQLNLKIAKEAVGKAAAALIKPGMVVGLGTGSTTAFFIAHLGRRCRDEGLQISGIPTSDQSKKQALMAGIPLADSNNTTFVDIAVDGADEVDEYNQLIKGGGGALLREKIVASMSREFVVIADSTKIVTKLGAAPLPVEIVPFAYKATVNHIQRLGYHGAIRRMPDGQPIITENENYIFDIKMQHLCDNPIDDDNRLKGIPGVVETGFFLNMANKILVGYPEGRVEVR